ncbi:MULTISPECIES: hypothetical protein [Mycolicibacterium]|jgi:hypothetical protein|uniref:Uncharacterized protein n=1 Tax=Mycolicibacterium chlorophenolicum TaxID=37916 RepID=A0A0J6WBQ5_9MYCO|nr:hypothetical protein [Mycolicibacterium chlorophenolicum]KMO79122.1 hypothetical protein MCHLDSM_01790 [Mycolicibacterium chlorophenolicum]
MVVLGVVLLVLAVVAVLAGLLFFGNARGTVPDRPGQDVTATRRGLSRINRSDLFATMRTSVKGAANSDAEQDKRTASLGGFLVLTGLVLVILAIVAFVVAMI